MREELQEANKKIEQQESEKQRKNIVVQGISIGTNNPNLLREAMGNYIEN